MILQRSPFRRAFTRLATDIPGLFSLNIVSFCVLFAKYKIQCNVGPTNSVSQNCFKRERERADCWMKKFVVVVASHLMLNLRYNKLAKSWLEGFHSQRTVNSLFLHSRSVSLCFFVPWHIQNRQSLYRNVLLLWLCSNFYVSPFRSSCKRKFLYLLLPILAVSVPITTYVPIYLTHT